MGEVTGKDYGLSSAPSHAPLARVVETPSASMTELDPDEFAALQARAKRRVKQPWDVAA